MITLDPDVVSQGMKIFLEMSILTANYLHFWRFTMIEQNYLQCSNILYVTALKFVVDKSI